MSTDPAGLRTARPAVPARVPGPRRWVLTDSQNLEPGSRQIHMTTGDIVGGLCGTAHRCATRLDHTNECSPDTKRQALEQIRAILDVIPEFIQE